ncbi:hypothetical protein ACFSKY_14685 [Azotobacter chroococcum]|uniref:hypothetical protein n=1 Tax=Azotobacter chroococcum TaxID=353 RepID=UPI00103F10B2|nr:hypothetical protein [Azotobacter chroococcum]TBV94042.1 hypothetical protein E0E53_15720 [Azotobacter chroococcum]
MSPTSTADFLRKGAIAAYISSLIFPAYQIRFGMGPFGIEALLLGWVTLFSAMTAWLANPIVIFCFFNMKATPRLCTVIGALALLAAHDFHNIKTLGFDSNRDKYANEVLGINAGCYLWLASLAISFVASAIYAWPSVRSSLKRVCT